MWLLPGGSGRGASGAISVVAVIMAGCLLAGAGQAHGTNEVDRPAGSAASSGDSSGSGSSSAVDDARGGNDWSCKPPAAHPNPVVLVHGYGGGQTHWAQLAPQLRELGYCVYSLDYGRDTSSVVGAMPDIYGTGDIRVSAQQVAGFTDRVRAATGAAKVDFVAASAGAAVVRQYLRFEGGASRSQRIITLAGANHGTALNGLASLVPNSGSAAPIAAVAGKAGVQLLADSEFIRTLNAGGDTEPGLAYTVLATRYDTVVTPVESTFLLAGPGATVDNITIQDVCPADRSGHSALASSATVAHLVKRALDPAYTGTLTCPR